MEARLVVPRVQSFPSRGRSKRGDDGVPEPLPPSAGHGSAALCPLGGVAVVTGRARVAGATRWPTGVALELPEADLDRRVVAALDRLALALDLLLRRAAREHDLSPLQVRLLVRLREEGGSRRRLRDLSRSCGVESAAVRSAIADLEARRLVERPPGERDARTVRLVLTRAGRSLALAVSGWADAVSGAVAGTPVPPKQALMPVLVGWVEALHRARVLTVARVCPTCRYFAPDIHPDGEAPHHCQLFERALAGSALQVDCPQHQPL